MLNVKPWSTFNLKHCPIPAAVGKASINSPWYLWEIGLVLYGLWPIFFPAGAFNIVSLSDTIMSQFDLNSTICYCTACFGIGIWVSKHLSQIVYIWFSDVEEIFNVVFCTQSFSDISHYLAKTYSAREESTQAVPFFVLHYSHHVFKNQKYFVWKLNRNDYSRLKSHRSFSQMVHRIVISLGFHRVIVRRLLIQNLEKRVLSCGVIEVLDGVFRNSQRLF